MCNVQGVGLGDSRFAAHGSELVSYCPLYIGLKIKKNKKKFKNRCNGVTYVTEGVQSQYWRGFQVVSPILQKVTFTTLVVFTELNLDIPLMSFKMVFIFFLILSLYI